ncbi:membrane protein insertion efficiency factor YidD [Pontiella sp.]|uniref:membrane protein insertion efficiency factor YidD n=1 Tax=Pontiella sp. TaxID=2837462 RepID=UPI003568BE0D
MTNIPTILIAGVFFFCAPGFADRLTLAEDLFLKGEWGLCHRECRRALLEGEEPEMRFRLLDAMSAVRSGAAAEAVAPQLAAIVEESREVQVSALAAYELGRQQWRMDRPSEAFNSIAMAFHSTTNKELFLHAACSLSRLMKQNPELRQNQEGLISQINTSRNQWYEGLFAQCGKPEPANHEPAAPGWIIGFYRSQISPAIGDRCNLQPSCSEYFVEARERRGLLAVPMIADRFVREPDVNRRQREPLIMEDGRIRYADPIEHHDFWMNP